MLGQPSVIARLMGMEDHHHTTTMPVRSAMTTIHASREETTIINLLTPWSQVEQPKCSPLGSHHGRRIGGDYYRYCLSKMKPRRRARRDRRRRDHPHPQEELLHKIKEDFRASWQLASTATPLLGAYEEEETVADASGRRRSGDRVAGLLDGRCIQRIAQENLRREKMARYGHGGRQSNVEEEEEDIKVAVVSTLKKFREAEQQQGGSEAAVSEESEEHDEHDHSSNASEKLRGMPATRIAILRPTSSITRCAAGDHRNAPVAWKAVRAGGMEMEEFLREVKERAERLKDEMKDKSDGAGDVVAKARRGWGSVSDDPERTARQIREAGVINDGLGKRLSRLESFRVFRGDRSRRDGAASSPSPEHRMLKSIMARTEAMSPTKITGRGPRGRWSPLRAGAGMNDRQSPDRGPRRSPTTLHKDGVDFVAASPRALVRSFSAPAAGCSDAFSEGAEKLVGRSRSFSLFRGTVASLKQSLCLGGGAEKLLLLLMQLSKKKPSFSLSPRQNFLAGLAPPSPVSQLEVHGGRNFSGDLNCALLPESSPRWSPRCSSELEASGVGGESPWGWTTDAVAERDDPDRAYVREVLLAAGLYDDDDGGGKPGSWEDAAVARTDSMERPLFFISDDVFEEVEDAYYYRSLRRAGKEEDHGAADRRRLLFDLANEALQESSRGIYGSSWPSSSLHWWVVGSNNGVPSSSRLRGRELEDEVWRYVSRAMVNGTAEREVGRSPWVPEAPCEDARAVGWKVERAIFDELVGDVVRQMFV